MKHDAVCKPRRREAVDHRKDPLAPPPLGPVADEFEAPGQLAGQGEAGLDEIALALAAAELRDVENDGWRAGRRREVEQFGEQQGVGDDGAAIPGTVRQGVRVPGEGGVGDNVPDRGQRVAIEPGQLFAGSERGDDGGLREGGLQAAGVTVGHPAHAQHDVGVEFANGGAQSGGEPVEPEVEWLERLTGDVGADELAGKHAARPESEQCRGVACRGESAGEKHRLALGAATPKPILDDDDFHCSARGRDEIRRRKLMRGLLNFVMRVAFIALGVALAARIVRGISYTDGETLLLVAVLLGLFNAFLKPLLVIFTLPFVVLSLGLGLWVINALLLWFAGRLVDGFQVRGVLAALGGALIISVTNMALSILVGAPKGPRPPPGMPPRQPPSGRGDVIDV
jgi:putative membrane protein